MALVRNTFEVQNVGDLLREKRKQLGIDIKQVAEDTKIRTEYLLALESSNFKKFPASVYAKGFLKKYAKYLGINAERVVAMYRREAKTKERGHLSNTEFLKNRLGPININLSTNKLITIAIAILVVAFGIYLLTQASSVLQKPDLQLTAPVTASAGANSTFSTQDETIDIKGKVEIGSKLQLNGSDVDVNNLQIFEIKDQELNIGENRFKLLAKSQFGQQSEINLLVVRETKTGTTTTTNKPTAADKITASVSIKNADSFVQIKVDGTPTLAQNLATGAKRDFTANSTFSISSTSPQNITLTINNQKLTLENSREHVYTLNPEGLVDLQVL